MENKEVNLEAFAGKKFYPEFSEHLKRFILDFDEVLGKYVSQDELLKRINETVDSISYGNLKESDSAGTYDPKTKSVKLEEEFLDKKSRFSQRNNENAVFFHEVGGHAIRTRNGMSGFESYFTVHDSDEKRKIVIGRGIEEGFAEYLTELKYPKYGTYPILTSIVADLIEITGEEKFLDMGLNHPEKLSDFLMENTCLESEYEVSDFLQDFDFIWQEEKKSNLVKGRK